MLWRENWKAREYQAAYTHLNNIGGLDLAEYPPAAAEEQFVLRRQGDALCAAVKQTRAQSLLQPADRLADGRREYAQRPPRDCETARLRLGSKPEPAGGFEGFRAEPGRTVDGRSPTTSKCAIPPFT
jgi:hypothetical protein